MRNFIKFIKLLEHITRTVLNKKLFICYCGSDIRKVLMDKFHGIATVNEMWSNLTEELRYKELSAKLIKMVFSKWINIRANSFIKCWIHIQKNKLFKKGATITEKAEPSIK